MERSGFPETVVATEFSFADFVSGNRSAHSRNNCNPFTPLIRCSILLCFPKKKRTSHSEARFFCLTKVKTFIYWDYRNPIFLNGFGKYATLHSRNNKQTVKWFREIRYAPFPKQQTNC